MSKSVTIIIGQGSRDFAHNLDDLLERWELAHYPEDILGGNDVRKMSGDEFSAYIKRADIDHLQELKRDLLTIHIDIKEFQSRSLQDHGGYPSNMGYNIKGHYFSAVRVRKKCGGYIDAINLELSKRRRNKLKDVEVQSIFIDLIWEREIIPHQKFQELHREARAIRKSLSENLVNGGQHD